MSAAAPPPEAGAKADRLHVRQQEQQEARPPQLVVRESEGDRLHRDQPPWASYDYRQVVAFVQQTLAHISFEEPERRAEALLQLTRVSLEEATKIIRGDPALASKLALSAQVAPELRHMRATGAVTLCDTSANAQPRFNSFSAAMPHARDISLQEPERRMEALQQLTEVTVEEAVQIIGSDPALAATPEYLADVTATLRHLRATGTIALRNMRTPPVPPHFDTFSAALAHTLAKLEETPCPMVQIKELYARLHLDDGLSRPGPTPRQVFDGDLGPWLDDSPVANADGTVWDNGDICAPALSSVLEVLQEELMYSVEALVSEHRPR